MLKISAQTTKSFVLLFFTLIFPSVLIAQITIYSNSSTGNDSSGDGTSGSPYKTFHKAYTEANSGDTINLTGTFTWTDADETGDVATNGYVINKDLQIIGDSENSTIIQADTTSFTADRKIFYIENVNLTVKNLTIQNGYLQNPVNKGGAGVQIRYPSNKSIIFENCIIKDNHNAGSYQPSQWYGGGAIMVYSTQDNTNGKVEFRKCTISNNSSVNQGGILWAYSGSSLTNNQKLKIIFDQCTLNDNVSSSGYNVYSYWTNFQIINSTLANNTSKYELIHSIGDGKLTIINSTVAYNTINESNYSTIEVDNSGYLKELYIKNSILSDNQSLYDLDTDFSNGGGNDIQNVSYSLIKKISSSTGLTNNSNGNVFQYTSEPVTNTLALNESNYNTKTLKLVSGSIAINAGDSTSVNGISIPTKDQRGKYRNSTIDIGSFEFNGTDVPPNSAPTNITLSTSSIAENNSIGDQIGTLSTTDVDSGDTFTYSLSGTDSSSFTISGSSLLAAEAFDYETKSSYTLSITTTDSGSLTFIKSFTISISDSNETPTDLSLSSSSIAENNSIGAQIGTLSTTDVDSGDTFTYSLSGTDASSFTISGSSLLAAEAFDYETKSSYTLSITTTDSGSLTFIKSFTISINDSNETPTNITLSASSISENNSVGAQIGTLSTTDIDSGDTFTYSLSGTDSSSFTISGSSLLAAEAFDYETKSSYSISISTTDSGTKSYSRAFTINIIDVTEDSGIDTDEDGIVDEFDEDDDGDGVLDVNDAFPLDANETVDTDGDGTGNNADTDDDNDGVLDVNDAFPLDANETVDTDGDGTGNNADTDDDGDGVFDVNDAFPLDATETVDTDGDGTGNNADTDDDNDGVLDVNDAFPLDATETVDTDGDGTGNNADTDDDGDSLSDTEEAELNTNPLLVDTDNDGVIDATEVSDKTNPLNPCSLIVEHQTESVGMTYWDSLDCDNDGVPNGQEVSSTPANSGSRTTTLYAFDTDGDGVLNYLDPDDDGDGVNTIDELLLNSSTGEYSVIDSDQDSTPNYLDSDDDNDGIETLVETSVDTDGDGTPNYLDSDDDGDGIITALELSFSDNENVTEFDSDGDGIPNHLDAEDNYEPTIATINVDPITFVYLDTDGDGIPNMTDSDDDNDGFTDAVEVSCNANPLRIESQPGDYDDDGIADCIDNDIDGDGVDNESDVFPLNPLEFVDTDGDGIGNNSDNDDDNDGVIDALDAFPLDPNESADTDNDGIGDNVDNDQFNDGFEDSRLEVSGVLTSNQSGIESTWKITNINLYPLNTISIYDKNRLLVYRAENYQNNWKGTYMDSQEQLPSGSYYYIVHLKSIDKKLTGWLYIAY
jgi:gliding motility-associated-like protein